MRRHVPGRHVFVERKALGREFVKPGHDERDRKADREYGKGGRAEPRGQVGEANHHLGHLHHQPGGHSIQHRHAQDVAALQFRDQSHDHPGNQCQSEPL